MNKEYTLKILEKSDEELINALENKEDYQEVAFNAIVRELKERGFSGLVNLKLKEYNKNEQESQRESDRFNNLPELFSNKAIIYFSAFCTTVWGSILMAYNFHKLGNNKKAELVLIFGLIYTTTTILIISITNFLLIKFFVQLLALLGGHILIYFFEKFYPKNLEQRNKNNYLLFFLAFCTNLIIAAIIVKTF